MQAVIALTLLTRPHGDKNIINIINLNIHTYIYTRGQTQYFILFY